VEYTYGGNSLREATEHPLERKSLTSDAPKSISPRREALLLQIEALLLQIEALLLQIEALLLQIEALPLHVEALLLQLKALLLPFRQKNH